MNNTIEIYDQYKEIGIKTRKITKGIEFDLVKAFIDYKKDVFRFSNINKLAIFIEPKIDNSYPDIVFVSYNPENYNNWNNIRKELSIIDYKILYHIFQNKEINANEITKQLGVTWKDTMLAVEKLYDCKFITRKNEFWRTKNKDVFSIRNIEAVEAKINKLDQVFQQALINKNFASESYVLSNLDKGITGDKLNKFTKFGIGIYTFNRNRFRRVNKSSKAYMPVSYSSIYFNEWLGKILMEK
ncbi:MAG: hypothetical protein APF84_04275 [Gracilibacter sp. BRH_c7a]|nr:MAG: hypothetical protein APF84_04275 [Gracilibacter sp. BRH_c7a]